MGYVLSFVFLRLIHNCRQPSRTGFGFQFAIVRTCSEMSRIPTRVMSHTVFLIMRKPKCVRVGLQLEYVFRTGLVFRLGDPFSVRNSHSKSPQTAQTQAVDLKQLKTFLSKNFQPSVHHHIYTIGHAFLLTATYCHLNGKQVTND